jgi:hypothetical protein
VLLGTDIRKLVALVLSQDGAGKITTACPQLRVLMERVTLGEAPNLHRLKNSAELGELYPKLRTKQEIFPCSKKDSFWDEVEGVKRPMIVKKR